jgi:hypothetical protein
MRLTCGDTATDRPKLARCRFGRRQVQPLVRPRGYRCLCETFFEKVARAIGLEFVDENIEPRRMYEGTLDIQGAMRRQWCATAEYRIVVHPSLRIQCVWCRVVERRLFLNTHIFA